MPDDLYERDILEWSDRQSDLLGRLARGERVDDAIDWPNVIEEVLSVGLSELHACQSLIRASASSICSNCTWNRTPRRCCTGAAK